MRCTTALLAACLLAATMAGCSSGKSQAEIQKECQAALTTAATKTNRPAECKDLSQEDYDTLLTAWVLKNTLSEMPKEDRDLLDYSDDGEINGSVG